MIDYSLKIAEAKRENILNILTKGIYPNNPDILIKGVYADNPRNRGLKRVGLTYDEETKGSTHHKKHSINPKKSPEEIESVQENLESIQDQIIKNNNSLVGASKEEQIKLKDQNKKLQNKAKEFDSILEHAKSVAPDKPKERKKILDLEGKSTEELQKMMQNLFDSHKISVLNKVTLMTELREAIMKNEEGRRAEERVEEFVPSEELEGLKSELMKVSQNLYRLGKFEGQEKLSPEEDRKLSFRKVKLQFQIDRLTKEEMSQMNDNDKKEEG